MYTVLASILVSYRLYDYKPTGQCNPDGSPCEGIIYRSFTMCSFADKTWLEKHQYIPGNAQLYGTSQPIPLTFFEPNRLSQKLVLPPRLTKVYASAGLR